MKPEFNIGVGPMHSIKILTDALTNNPIPDLTVSEIVGTDASKKLVSLAVATYPSMTELSYVKGVTSAIQTQLGLLAPLASPTFTGTVTLPTLTTIPATGALAMAVDNQYFYIQGSTRAAGKGAVQILWGKDAAGAGRWNLYTPDVAGTADVGRIQVTGNLATAEMSLTALTVTGLVLSGALDANGQALNNTPSILLTPSGAPATTEGNLYYDSTAHKLKVRVAAGWETVTSA